MNSNPRCRWFFQKFALCVAITAAALDLASAQEGETPLRLELNRLEPVQGETCRAYLVIENASPDAYSSLKLDLFAFDTDGVIAKRVAVEAGPIAAKKTSVKLFDFTGLSCERFSRVLLSDVIACETAKGSKVDCTAAIQTDSKIARVSFIK